MRRLGGVGRTRVPVSNEDNAHDRRYEYGTYDEQQRYNDKHPLIVMQSFLESGRSGRQLLGDNCVHGVRATRDRHEDTAHQEHCSDGHHDERGVPVRHTQLLVGFARTRAGAECAEHDRERCQEDDDNTEGHLRLYTTLQDFV